MAEKTVSISQSQSKPIKIIKWKVREGLTIPIGRLLLLYEIDGPKKEEQRKLKSTQAGTVHKIIAREGETVKPREILLELKACCHPTIMNDMCAECGADLRKDDITGTASVPMVHAIPDLKVSEEQAQKLGRADSDRLIKDHKLVLLVDLDQTLIHTTNDNIPPNIKDVYHFQLYGPNSPWYHTRLRPGTHRFLNNIYDYYELHICTFGARNYAHTIAMFLDADQKIFSNRILSRDECFDPTSKKANLKALFPCGDDMVCIIDDREDVWSHASNLIHVKPYHFFQHTGDINAPPGLDKHEDDNKAGFDLTKLKEKVVLNSEHLKDRELLITNGSTGTEIEAAKGNDCSMKISVDKDVKLNGNSCDENEKIEEVTFSKNETGCEESPTDKNEKKENQRTENVDSAEVPQQVTSDVNKNENLETKAIKAQEKCDNDASKTNTETKEPIPEPDKTSAKEKPSQEDNLIEIDDPDDYLVYLEDILKMIHKEFYDQYDKMESGEIPDLKKVIPLVRSNVLKGCKLVFSGLVPTHIKLEQSKAYQVARSIGAIVTQDLEDDTTHLVAVRPGTAKVNAGRRKKNLRIVTPDWLWSCAERWEHVDERIFPLSSKGSKNRHPPPHCSSPDHITSYPEHNTPALRKRTPSGRFMDTINPLMSFSSADIADMDKEVEDILDDESDSSEDDQKKLEQTPVNLVIPPRSNSSSSSSSEDSLTGEYPRGFKRKRQDEEDNGLDENNSTEDEMPSIKFRRGESVDDVLDMDQDDTQESDNSVEPPDEVDDGDWNMMGAALEREFLSNN
ncbi:RNA polymerase II subunit A C-terminal domain phosphatase [Anoplophora glabripennis]|nr:RNA polymerase II subunit A C-terminal domain phosphatase [Anoplophora glabripennis]